MSGVNRVRNRIAAAMILLSTAIAPFECQAKPEQLRTSAGELRVEELATGLHHPWGMEFLPDGRLLVTEREGRLRILGRDSRLSPPIDGVPEVFARGQGGLLDVAIDPGFEKNRFVYLSFSEPGQEGASTALGRGRLSNGKLEDFRTIFRQEPKVGGANHFGGRIVFGPEESIFLVLGERYQFHPAQERTNHLGAIVRIKKDGKPFPKNPFIGQQGAAEEIWTYGHRNIEAAAIDPATGFFWGAEMGPKGGDELNLIERGKNYGWPLVSWGTHYNGEDIPDPPTRPEFTDAIKQWTPVISPSGMIFYTGRMFPAWKGQAFIGGLTHGELVRVRIEGQRVTDEERIPLGSRIRDVEQAPDGSLYVLTDESNGKVWRLSGRSENAAAAS